MKPIKSGRLLDGASSTGVGQWFTFDQLSRGMIYFTSTGVTTGCTIDIEAQAHDGTAHKIVTQTVTANTSSSPIKPITFELPITAFRGNISAYTDGTHIVCFSACNS
jgi:hypothetical protein